MKFQNDRSDKWLLLFMFMESKQSSHVLELDLMCKIKKYIPQPHLDGYILWEQPILGSNTFIKKPMVGVNNESLKGMPLFTWLNKLQWTKFMKRGDGLKRKW